jgi:hypothetical protein
MKYVGLFLALMITPVAAAELPSCGDPQVQETLVGPLNNISIRGARNRELSPRGAQKKWCAAAIFQRGFDEHKVIYTIEWVNENENYFWVELKQR